MLIVQLSPGLAVCGILVDRLMLLIGIDRTLESCQRALVPPTSCGFLCSGQCSGRRRRTSRYASRLRRVGMMLVRLMKGVWTRRRWPIVSDGSYLGRWTVASPIRWHWALRCAVSRRRERHRTKAMAGAWSRSILGARVVSSGRRALLMRRGWGL